MFKVQALHCSIKEEIKFKMKIAQSIFFSFLFILLLFSFTTYINYRLSDKVKENTDYISRSSTIVRQSNRFQRNILNMASGIRGYLLTGDSSFLQTYDTAALENKAILTEFAQLPDPRQQVPLQRISMLNQKWLQEFSSVLADSNNTKAFQNKYATKISQSKDVAFFYDERLISKNLQTELRKFINEEYKRQEEQKKMLTASIQRTKNISFYLTTISIVIGFLVAVMLARNLSKRILKMVEMSNSIAKGNYKVQMIDKKEDELGKLSTSLNHMANVLSNNFSLLKRKNEELDQFAHIVSHDLKTPLRGISNVVSWIEEDHGHELSPKVHDYLQLIHGRLMRAENLIKGILSYARIETDASEKEEVDVNDLINEIVDNLILPPALSLQVEQKMPVLFTERLLLFQVFSNLITNAVKYHDKTEGIVKIYFKENQLNYQFFIEDNGPGIAPNHQDKIFKIFQTLNEKDSFESTGVGLAIVKKILDSRKETIGLKSELGKGSVFSFTWTKK